MLHAFRQKLLKFKVCICTGQGSDLCHKDINMLAGSQSHHLGLEGTKILQDYLYRPEERGEMRNGAGRKHGKSKKDKKRLKT